MDWSTISYPMPTLTHIFALGLCMACRGNSMNNSTLRMWPVYHVPMDYSSKV